MGKRRQGPINKKVDFLSNKLNKYSIRKFTVGTASILVGATLIFGHSNDEAKAAEVNKVDSSAQLDQENVAKTNFENESQTASNQDKTSEVTQNDDTSNQDKTSKVAPKENSSNEVDSSEVAPKENSSNEVDSSEVAPKEN
ncbi:YSIRK-type signal peptide-containing protein, partial [Staphylococcus epidermidis]